MEDTVYSHSAMDTVSHNNNLPDKICQLVQYWHQSYGNNQSLTLLKLGQIHKLESIPDSANKTKNLRLDKSWILKENQLLLLW